MTMTQAEFDAKVASGELTPVNDSESTDILIKMNRPYNSQEKSYLNRIGNSIRRDFKSKERQNLAEQIIMSGATPQSIGNYYSILLKEETTTGHNILPTYLHEKLNRELYDNAMSIADPIARGEAIEEVVADSKMSYKDKIKAIYHYKHSYGTKKEIQKRTDSFFRLLDEQTRLNNLVNPTDSDKQRLKTINKAITKRTSPRTSPIAKNKEAQDEIIDKFKLSLPENLRGKSLATLDMSLLSKEQKAEANEVANWMLKAQNPKGSAKIMKKINDDYQQMNQIGNALSFTMKELAKGEDFNSLDSAIKNKVLTYTGLSTEQADRAFRDKQFQSFINKYRNGLFGASLTAGETDEFLKEASTIYRSNSDIAVTLKSILSNKKANIEGYKQILSPRIFNLKFGELEKQTNYLLDSIDGKTKTQPKNRYYLRQPKSEPTPSATSTKKEIVFDSNNLDILDSILQK